VTNGINHSNFFQGDGSVSYKQSTGLNYRTIINATNINMCAYFNGEKHVLVKWVFDLTWKELPQEYLHPCPYVVRFNRAEQVSIEIDHAYFQGPIALNNVTIDLNIISKFPRGLYKMHLRFFNQEDPNVITGDVVFEVAGTQDLDF
jgi:hypothetical protein